MDKPVISVIIPTYNRKKFIPYAVDSVLNQSFSDFELIIIDDGSTDGTDEYIKSLKDNRIKYIYQQNAGNHAARNTGLKIAKGKYIALLDSDDMWLPEKLMRQKAVLDEKIEYGLVYCGSLTIDSENNLTGLKPIINHSGKVFDKMLMTNFLYNGSNVLFRRKCLEKVGNFNTNLSRMLDWDFYLRFSLYYKFFCLDEYLVKYRVHDDSLSKNFIAYEQSGLMILDNIFATPNLSENYKNLKNKAYARRFRYMGIRYLENNKMKDARINLLNAIYMDNSLLFTDKILIMLLLTYFPAEFLCYIRQFRNQLKKLNEQFPNYPLRNN